MTNTDVIKLREALEELAELMQGVIDGDYKPDSFTLQPARAALAATASVTEAVELERIKHIVTTHKRSPDIPESAHPSPAAAMTEEPNPLDKRCYVMSEPHLSGHRVIIGFNTLEEAQDAHLYISSATKKQGLTPKQELQSALSGGKVWLVLDEDGHPNFCAGWPEACHEHINDAISEHDLEEAGKWRVVSATIDAASPAIVKDGETT